jgi:hypothetical protein
MFKNICGKVILWVIFQMLNVKVVENLEINVMRVNFDFLR